MTDTSAEVVRLARVDRMIAQNDDQILGDWF